MSLDRSDPIAKPMPDVTRRERDVLAALCRPLASDRPVAMPASIREIAAELVVTEAAVKQHLLNLYDKFDIVEGLESRRIALAREAVLRGFVGIRAAAAPVLEGEGALAAGRAAAVRRSWSEAVEALSAAAASSPLDVADLELLGDCATWAGQFDRSTTVRDQAYARYLALGDRRSAARVALGLGWNAAVTLRFSVVSGWLHAAGRLLAPDDGADGSPVWPEHGLMLSLMALGEYGAGATDPALAHAREAFDIGRRTGDRDIQALGLVFEGFGLIHQGLLDDGRARLDEAMANAVGGQLGTLAQGMVYCRTLSACVDTFDYRRAIEWTDTIERRAPELGTLGFPGDCRTHRAVLCVVRGEWTRGAAEAELAATEAMAYDLGHTAQALSALGEIRLRQGDLDAARTAFDRADAFGLPLGPGPASLLLATGDAAGAQSAITGALASVPPDALTRARYLPTAVRAAVVVHDLGQAEALETELASIADRFAGPALIAASLDARGAVALARGDTEAAVGHFRGAARRWRAAGAPYEVARSLLETARALEDTGDRPAALREARASRTTFEELGASLDVQTASSFLDATDRGGSQPDTSDG